jgi:serine/threonine protein kinase
LTEPRTHSHRHRPREPILESGDALDDDLRVIEHLGGSRKVDIYLCRSKERGELVACKVLRPEYRIDYRSLSAVLREGELLLKLRHPNVIEGYRVELEPDPRIVMQRLPGMTLDTAFLRGNYGAYRVRDFVGVATQIADALTYLHEQNLVHLDVKPSNVMYSDGHVTLFDLSVGRDFKPEDRLRIDAGTTDYMAPEQTNLKNIGHYTDVFGLGVVFYRLLTAGELPYGSEQRTDEDGESERVLVYEPVPTHPSDLNADVSRAIGDCALRALAPDPDERYANPEEFKSALLAAVQD